MVLMTKISVKISDEFFYDEILSDKLRALMLGFLSNQLLSWMTTKSILITMDDKVH